MGNTNGSGNTFDNAGTLGGPGSSSVTNPGKIPLPPTKLVEVVIPQNISPGQTFAVCVDGTNYGLKATGKPGTTARFNVPDLGKVVTSTLSVAPPGYTIKVQKPILWASESKMSTCWFANASREINQVASEKFISSQLEHVKNELLQQTHAASCNSLLGLNFSITTDSSDSWGQLMLTVAAFGTPCVITSDIGDEPEYAVAEAVPIKATAPPAP